MSSEEGQQDSRLTKEQIEAELRKQGATDFVVRPNVRVKVPESENPYIAKSQYYEDEVDASLWATVITPDKTLAEKGPQPTILLVSAYKKEFMSIFAAPMVKFGYNVVLVDMRAILLLMQRLMEKKTAK